MAGTKEGAAKRRATLIAKAGGEAAYLAMQRSNAAKGGANSNPDNPANFKNNRKLARKAGKKSGKVRAGRSTTVGTEAPQGTIGTEPGGNYANEN